MKVGGCSRDIQRQAGTLQKASEEGGTWGIFTGYVGMPPACTYSPVGGEGRRKKEEGRRNI